MAPSAGLKRSWSDATQPSSCLGAGAGEHMPGTEGADHLPGGASPAPRAGRRAAQLPLEEVSRERLWGAEGCYVGVGKRGISPQGRPGGGVPGNPRSLLVSRGVWLGGLAVFLVISIVCRCSGSIC